LLAIEKLLQRELNDLNEQLQLILSEFDCEERKSNEYSMKYNSLVQEENECQLKIYESKEQILVVSQKFAEIDLGLQILLFISQQLIHQYYSMQESGRGCYYSAAKA